MTNERFDIYIISSVKDLDNIQRNLVYIKKYISADNVYVVTKKVSKQMEKTLPLCEFIDENSILSGLDYNSVKEELFKYSAIEGNVGWYFQQFLKFACAFISKNRYYLVWDADTLPLRKIDFFDNKGRPFFNLKREFVPYYFSTIKNLFGYCKKTKESFISEHMLFDAAIVKEMIAAMEANNSLSGDSFWKKILSVSFSFDDSRDGAQRNFSEFETYGTYCDYKHPGCYNKRKLVTLRYGSEYLGSNPSSDVLEWAARDFDTISFEDYERNKKVEFFIKKTKDSNLRAARSLRKMLKQHHSDYKRQLRKALFSFNEEKIKELKTKNNYFRYDFVFGNKLDYYPLRVFIDNIKKHNFCGIKNNVFLKALYQKMRMCCNILAGRDI